MVSRVLVAYDRMSKELFLVLLTVVLLFEALAADEPRLFQILLVGSVSFISSTLVNLLIKDYIRSHRPTKRHGPHGHPLAPIVKYSFPSYHTQIGFTMVTVASLYLREYSMLFPVAFFAIAIFTAYSRHALRAHFMRDIYAGAVIGTALGVLVYFLLRSFLLPLPALLLFFLSLALFFAIPFGTAPESPREPKRR